MPTTLLPGLLPGVLPGPLPMHGIGGAKDLPISPELAISGAVAALTISFIVLALAWRTPRYDAATDGRPAPAALSTLITSTGWSVAMRVLGLVVFVLGKPLLMGKGEPKDPAKIKGGKEFAIYGAGIAMVLLCWAAIQYQEMVGYVLGTFGGGLVLYVLFTAVTKLHPEERDRIFAAMFLILTSIVFWALFEQAGSSLNLFTDRHVDTQGVNASMFQSVNAIYIVLLAPVFAFVWQTLARKGKEPSTPLKFGLAIIQVGLGFLVLVWGAESVGVNVPTPVIFIFLIYLLHTTGELCLSPVGLSAMNRLAPSHMASLIMGTWFFASATGNFAAGLIASATGAEGVGEEAGKQVVLGVYSTVGWYAVGIGVAVMVLSPLIKKLMHLDTIRDDTVGDDLEGQAGAGLEPQEAGMHPSTNPQAPGVHEQNR